MKKIFTYAFVFLLISFFIASFFRHITAIDLDLGRQILLGQIISSTHNVYHTNPLSYTNPNFQFIDTHWLSSVIFYQINKIGGFNLLQIGNVLMAGLAYGILIYFALKKYSVASVLATTSLFLVPLSLRSDIRPEIFSMLFLAIFMVCLYDFREKGSRKILFLIPLEVIWVNLHIYFIFGPFLVFLFLLDEFIAGKFRFTRKVKMYSAVLLGTLTAALFNPSGLKGAISPLIILPNYGVSISENNSLFVLFNLSPFIVGLLFGSIAFLFLLLIVGRRNTKPLDWFLITIFSLSSILVFRNVVLLIFTTFIAISAQLDYVLKKYQSKITKHLGFVSWIEYSMVLALVLVITLQAIVSMDVGFGLNDPAKLAGDYFVNNNLQSPVYNNFNIGGYLAYRIYPKQVYVDNRPEAYPKSFFQKTYLPMDYDPSIFETEDEKYHFNAIFIHYWGFIHPKEKLLSYLVNNSEFAPVYLDPYVIILLRKTDSNQLIINRDLITQENVNLSTINDNEALKHYIYFFDGVDWADKKKEAVAKLSQN